jgi:hypothetical protein
MRLKSTSPDGFQIDFQFTQSNQVLNFEFHLSGPLELLEIPEASSAPVFKNELWTNTCFEIFLKNSSVRAYQEWNFSPSQDWAFFDFVDYRTLNPDSTNQPPLGPFDLRRSKDYLIIGNRIPLNQANSLHPCTILKKKNGDFSFWSLSLQSKPDFHALSLYQKFSNPS